MTLTTITTERLQLRAFCEDDAQDVFDACSNPVLGHNAGWPPHESIQDALSYINDIVPLGYVWAIVEKGGKRVVGSVGLLDDPRAEFANAAGARRTMMLGYWIAQDKWNLGYATEASRAVLTWAFENLELERVTTSHYLFNDASRRVIEKCGFERREIAPWPSDDESEPEQDVQWYELRAR